MRIKLALYLTLGLLLAPLGLTGCSTTGGVGADQDEFAAVHENRSLSEQTGWQAR